tara:strand:+ start:9267 stop:10088 length:822 start_codon:yes stop_codon:yes gene_type:complete
MSLNQSNESFNLTVIIPTKNSEGSLRRSLDSVKSCKDVLVVDSSSTDKTKSIVEHYNRRYVNFIWNNKYPKKRAWALANSNITTDWILMLDSDECVNNDFLLEFKKNVVNSRHNAFWVEYNNYFLGGLLKYGIKQKKLTLIRKDMATYEDFGEQNWTKYDMEIHEHLMVSGSTGKMSNRLNHNQNEDYESMLSKHYEYAQWESNRYKSFNLNKKSTIREKLKYKLLNKFFFPHIYFIIQFIVFLGILDGIPGYKYAMIKFKYFRRIYELLKKK